jgi:hypothetical protein
MHQHLRLIGGKPSIDAVEVQRLHGGRARAGGDRMLGKHVIAVNANRVRVPIRYRSGRLFASMLDRRRAAGECAAAHLRLIGRILILSSPTRVPGRRVPMQHLLVDLSRQEPRPIYPRPRLKQ